MITLGVNIDHVATIREARKGIEPDPVWASSVAQLAGCHCITLHLREDRRHIQDRDLKLIKDTVSVKLNLEMAGTQQHEVGDSGPEFSWQSHLPAVPRLARYRPRLDRPGLPVLQSFQSCLSWWS